MTFDEWMKKNAFPVPPRLMKLCTQCFEAGQREAYTEILLRQMEDRERVEASEAKRLKNLKSLPGA